MLRPTVSINDQVFHTVQVMPSEAYTRRAPVIRNAPPDLLKFVQTHLAQGTVAPPDARIGNIKDATILKRGIIVDRQGRIIKESLLNVESEEVFLSEIAPSYDIACRSPSSIEELPRSDRPYVLLKQTWDDNYGHWLIESLPRLAVVKQKFDVCDLLFIVSYDASPAMRQVYIDSLAMFGVAIDQILLLPDESRRVANVIYPTPLTVQPWIKAPAVVRILSGLTAFGDPDTLSPERLFVSRSGWGNRRLLNEADVLAPLRSRGFTVVRPEEYSFSQQVALFSRAKLIVGTLGAGLSNVVFAPDGVKLLALTTERMGDDFFWDLISLKEGDYFSIHGETDDPNPTMYSDFTIDLSLLERSLQLFDP